MRSSYLHHALSAHPQIPHARQAARLLLRPSSALQPCRQPKQVQSLSCWFGRSAEAYLAARREPSGLSSRTASGGRLGAAAPRVRLLVCTAPCCANTLPTTAATASCASTCSNRVLICTACKAAGGVVDHEQAHLQGWLLVSSKLILQCKLTTACWQLMPSLPETMHQQGAQRQREERHRHLQRQRQGQLRGPGKGPP